MPSTWVPPSSGLAPSLGPQRKRIGPAGWEEIREIESFVSP